jgi:osmoprotectant transport system permease protein
MPPAVVSVLTLADDPGNPWFSWEYIRRNSEPLTTALVQHISLTLGAVGVAAVVGVALAVVAARVPALAGVLLSLTSVAYTIPSLALFALLGPTLGLKFRTVLVGLALYALVMVTRGGLTGLRQVPADVRDSAQGMGYGPLAMLWRIELPLALPSIMGGIRLATVSTVALVTVGTMVGYGGLGYFILTGFNFNFYRAMIMAGTLGCIALALLLDLVLAGATRLVTPWARRGRA